MKRQPADGLRERAKALRRNLTEAEKKLWAILRLRQMDGHKFRRQVPFGRYVADFACHEARLIVEVDGGQHDPSLEPEARRLEYLSREGYRVLRFWNNDVLENPEGVHAAITKTLRGPNAQNPPP